MLTKLFNETLFPSYENIFRDFGTKNLISNVNIKETENSYQIEMLTPGINKKDIKINLDDDILTISSKTKKEQSQKENEFILQEFNNLEFERKFRIPNTISTENITAKQENGILSIELLKDKKKLKQKKIDIT